MSDNQETNSSQVHIVRGHFDSLSLFEITDYELEQLAQGAPSSTLLNFAIFFLSIALSFIAALLTANLTDRVYLVFVVIVVVGFSIGIVLLVLWYRTHTKISKLVEKIKRRATSIPGRVTTPIAGKDISKARGSGRTQGAVTESPSVKPLHKKKK